MLCHRRNPGKSQSRLPPPFSRTPWNYFRFNNIEVYRTDPIFHSYFQGWFVHVAQFDCSLQRKLYSFHSHTHAQLRSRPKHLSTLQLPSADTKTEPYADILGGLPKDDQPAVDLFLQEYRKRDVTHAHSYSPLILLSACLPDSPFPCLLPVCLFICLSVLPPACLCCLLPVSVASCLSALYLPVCVASCLFICLSMLPVCLSACYLPVCVASCLSACFSAWLCCLLPVFLPVCVPPACLPVICLSVLPPACLPFTCLYVLPPARLPVYLLVCVASFLSVLLLPVCVAPACLCCLLPVCLFICLSVLPPPCLPVYLPVCVASCLSACLLPPACLPVYLPVCVASCLPVLPPVCVASCLSVLPPACLSACLSCILVWLPAVLSYSAVEKKKFLHSGHMSSPIGEGEEVLNPMQPCIPTLAAISFAATRQLADNCFLVDTRGIISSSYFKVIA